jgi:hypothetical protein
MSYKRMVGLVVLFFLMVLTGNTLAAAQKIEIIGAIDAVTADTITVHGYTVHTTGALIQATLEVNKGVKIEGTLLSDGSVQAREIYAIRLSAKIQTLELVGVVTSIDETTIGLDGQSFSLAGAQIKGTIVVGDTVKVEAVLQTDGTWAAREVRKLGAAKAPANGEIEIVGTLTEVGDGFVVVSGQRFDTTGAEIHDPLMAGMTVNVHARLVNGQMLATEIESTYHTPRVTAEATLSPDGEHGPDDHSSGGQDDHSQSQDDHGKDGSGHDSGDDHGGGHNNSGHG